MTFVHWMQAIWAVSTLTLLAQIYWLERIKRKLRKQSAVLAAMIESFTKSAAVGPCAWRELTTKEGEKSDQATPPIVH